MPLKTTLDRQVIDATIEFLLIEFYSLPLSDAIAALAELSRLPNPLHPELFQEKVYQSHDIQNALKELKSIMDNKQPQMRPARGENEQPDNWGKFSGLLHQEPEKRNASISVGGQLITAEDVYHYMRYKFAETACNILALSEAKNILRMHETESKHENENALTSLYLAKWIGAEEVGMPEKLKQILTSNGIDIKICEKLLSILSKEDDGFHVFLPYLDQESIGFQSEIKQNIRLSDRLFLLDKKKIVQNLCSSSPALFDKELEDNLEILFSGRVVRGNMFKELKIFKSPPYHSLQEKIKNQINTEKNFSRSVLLSFIKITEAKEMINQYQDALNINNKLLIDEVNRICHQYIDLLTNTPEENWKPLESEKLTKVDEVFASAKLFSVEIEFIDRISSFFALYFGAENNNQKNSLFLEMLYAAHVQNKIFIEDNWIQTIYEESLLNSPEEKGVVYVTPYHRNRIFLHAFTVPVTQWSDIYYQTLTEILHLLKQSTDRSVLNEMQSSYPTGFLQQLDWLRSCYEFYVLSHGEGERPAPPESLFPIICHSQNIAELIENVMLHKLTIENLIVLFHYKKDDFVRLIKSKEDLIFLVNRNVMPFSTLLSLDKEVWSKLIHNIDDLFYIIDYFRVRYFSTQISMLLVQLKNEFSRFITHVDDLCHLINLWLASRDKDDIFLLLECLKDEIPKLVHNLRDLGDMIGVFQYISDTTFPLIRDLLQAVKSDFPKWINNMRDLKYIVNIFRVTRRSNYILLDNIKDTFPRFLTGIEDLIFLLGHQHYYNGKATLNDFQDQLPEWTANITMKDLISLLNLRLSGAEYFVLLNHLEAQLPRLFNSMNYEDLVSLFKIKVTDPDIKKIMFQHIKNEFPRLLNNMRDLFDLIVDASLLHDDLRLVLNSVKHNFPQWLQETNSLKQFQGRLYLGQKVVIAESMIEELPRMTKTAEDFLSILTFLRDFFDCAALNFEGGYDMNLSLYKIIVKKIIESCKDHWSHILKTEADCKMLASCLDPKSVAEVCDIMLVSLLDNFIKSPKTSGFFGYSKPALCIAAVWFKEAIISQTPLKEEYIKILLSEPLNSILKNHIQKFYQGRVSLEDFLEKKAKAIPIPEEKVAGCEVRANSR